MVVVAIIMVTGVRKTSDVRNIPIPATRAVATQSLMVRIILSRRLIAIKRTLKGKAPYTIPIRKLARIPVDNAPISGTLVNNENVRDVSCKIMINGYRITRIPDLIVECEFSKCATVGLKE